MKLVPECSNRGAGNQYSVDSRIEVNLNQLQNSRPTSAFDRYLPRVIAQAVTAPLINGASLVCARCLQGRVLSRPGLVDQSVK